MSDKPIPKFRQISAPKQLIQQPQTTVVELEIREARFDRSYAKVVFEILGRLVGFEPTTSAATERRSATEL
jgi:hypothetical protein